MDGRNPQGRVEPRPIFWAGDSVRDPSIGGSSPVMLLGPTRPTHSPHGRGVKAR